MSVSNNIPSPGVPMVGQDGRLLAVWFQFFLTLFARTGGTMGQDTTGMQTELEQGNPQPDLAQIYGLIATVESLAAQAQAQTAAVQQRDERGEAGDGASLTYLTARISELESRIEAMCLPILTDTAELSNGAQFLAAPGGSINSTPIGSTTASTGSFTTLAIAPATTTISPAAGAAGALPTAPAGYASITIGVASRKIPYY